MKIKAGTMVMVADSQEELDENNGIIKPLIGFYDGFYYIPSLAGVKDHPFAQGFRFCKKIKQDKK